MFSFNNKLNIEKTFGMSEEEFRQHIASAISISIKPVKINKLEITPERKDTTIIRGTQSSIFHIHLEDYNVESSDKQLPTDYTLKILNPEVVNISDDSSDIDVGKKYMREAGVLHITNRRDFDFTSYGFSRGRQVKLYPYWLGSAYEPFKNLHWFLFERLRDKSVYTRFTELRKEDVNMEEHVFPALNPVLLHHEKLLLFEDEFERAVGGEKIHLFSDELYTKRFLHYLEMWADKPREKWPKGIEDKIAAAFMELSPRFLTHDGITTLIQHDGYPWHNMYCSLVDSGNVRYGSRALHLASLFGERNVYEKLPPEAYRDIAREYIRKNIKLITEDFGIRLDRYRLGIERVDLPVDDSALEIVADELKLAMFFCSGFSNARLAAGLSHYRNGKSDERKMEQYKIAQTFSSQMHQLATYLPIAQQTSVQHIIEGTMELGIPGFADKKAEQYQAALN